MSKFNKFLYSASTLIIILNALIVLLYSSLSYTNLVVNKSYFVYGIAFLNILIAGVFIITAILRTDIGNYSKTSIVCSLLFWIPALNMIAAFLAISFAIASIKQKQKGQGFAIAGLTIGIATILFSILGGIVYYFFPSVL